jgi:predicted O-methyltransferase YrrM
MSFETAFASVQDVDGWLTREQARLLYDRAVELRPGATIVEIGSHHGRSTIILAQGAPEAQVVAIDPYEEDEPRPEDLRTFESTIERAGVQDRVRHIHDSSSAALKRFEGAVDLLYVDGAHDFPIALADIRGWGSRVRDGGVMLIHDSFSSVGVTLAQVVALFASDTFRYVGRSRSLAEYRRERVSRTGNVTRQTAQLPWFVRNVVVKLALVARARPVAAALGHREDVFPY